MNLMRAALLVLLSFAVNARAGVGNMRGDEEGIWSPEGGYSVIAARIDGIRELPGPPVQGTHQARLRPIALLAGTLDPSSTASLPVHLYFSRAVSSVAALPPDGSMVLAVVLLRESEPEKSAQSAMIVAASCEFMPGRSALVPITSLADPKVEETLRTLQRTRSEPPRDTPRRRPASAPSSQPSE